MKRLNIIRFLLICGISVCSYFTVCGQDDSPASGETKQSVHSKKAHGPAPVAPFNDTLFYVKTGVGLFTPRDRADAISERIRSVIHEYGNFHSDSLIVMSDGGLYEIVYRNIIIMTVNETDALLNKKSQLDLANEYKTAITDSILLRQKDTHWRTVVMRVLLVLLILAVQYIFIKGVNRLFRIIDDKIDKLKGTKIKTIKFKTYKLLDEEKTTKFIHVLFRILRYAIIILTLYLSIPMAFSIFPATRGLAAVLFGYILTPLTTILKHIVEFIPNLIKIVIIIFVFRYVIKGLRAITEEISKGRLTFKGFYADWAYPTFNIIRTLLYAFMFVMIWPYLPGSNSPVFQGVTVFIGIIFSLGSSSVVNNVISGMVLTYMRSFNMGDRIKIGDITGNIVEKTPLVTRIRTLKNEEVTLPNSSIMSAQTFNYSLSAQKYGLILHSEFTFGYDTPWRKIHEMLLEAARRTPDALKNPKPFILQTALDDFYAQYQLNIYIRDADSMPRIYSELHQNVQDVFNEEGVEIMSPHYQAVRDGNQITIPSSYLSGAKKV